MLGFVGLGKLEPNITVVGLHYVQAAHRGKGIGTQIFDEITKDSVEEGRNICLNGGELLYCILRIFPERAWFLI